MEIIVFRGSPAECWQAVTGLLEDGLAGLNADGLTHQLGEDYDDQDDWEHCETLGFSQDPFYADVNVDDQDDWEHCETLGFSQDPFYADVNVVEECFSASVARADFTRAKALYKTLKKALIDIAKHIQSARADAKQKLQERHKDVQQKLEEARKKASGFAAAIRKQMAARTALRKEKARLIEKGYSKDDPRLAAYDRKIAAITEGLG